MRMSYDEYDKLVEMGEEIEKAYFDEEEMDLDKKFFRRVYKPTVEDIDSHSILSNPQKYLPYLIYYCEVYKAEDESEKEVQNYIKRFLYKHLQLEP